MFGCYFIVELFVVVVVVVVEREKERFCEQKCSSALKKKLEVETY